MLECKTECLKDIYKAHKTELEKLDSTGIECRIAILSPSAEQVGCIRYKRDRRPSLELFKRKTSLTVYYDQQMNRYNIYDKRELKRRVCCPVTARYLCRLLKYKGDLESKFMLELDYTIDHIRCIKEKLKK